MAWPADDCKVRDVLGSFVLSGLLSGLIFGVDAFDPWTYGDISIVLFAVAGLECDLRARRVAACRGVSWRVVSMIALRYE